MKKQASKKTPIKSVEGEVQNEAPKKEKSRRYILLLFVIPISIYFYFALQHLTQFETADEHLWISNLYTGRIQQYWNAINQKDWPETKINDKPGVTLALISGIGMRWESNVQNKIVDKENLFTVYNPEKTQETYRLYRLPIVIANGIMGLFFFLALWRLTRKHWLSLAAAGLIVVSPTLIGISQIINPDAFLWTFSFAAILSFMLFLQDRKWWASIIDCLLAAIFLGLAFLSKYVALVFFPFFLAMMLWYLFYNRDELVESGVFRKKAIFASIGYSLVIAGAVGTFALLMPAALVDNKTLLKFLFRFAQMKEILIICGAIDAFVLLDAVLIKSWIVKFLSKQLRFLRLILPKIFYAGMFIWFTLVLLNWGTDRNFLDVPIFSMVKGSDEIFKHANLFQKMILESKALVFSLTPIALFLMLFLWAKSIVRKSHFDDLVFLLTTVFFVFYFAVIQQKLLVNIRYSIVLYPIAFSLAGIGFYELTKSLKHRYVLPLFLIVFAASIYSIWQIKPFYFNYTNDILPKNISIADSWGYGGYEALQYIKAQGGADKIYSDYYGICQFFDGKCVTEGQTKWMKHQDVMNIDYVVTSFDGVKKNTPGINAIDDDFDKGDPVWELDIDGRPNNFIKVYKNNFQD
ncbi:MAG TPA: phospholipid carrier-dependent glycosyltransferase [Patescibacteria group bacterium]